MSTPPAEISEAVLRITQKCLPALTAKNNSSTLVCEHRTDLKDEELKTELELQLAHIDQAQNELLNFVREINTECENYKALVPTLFANDEEKLKEETDRYSQVLHDSRGPLDCVKQINEETQRLANEELKVRRFLDAVNSRLSLSENVPVTSGAVPLRVAAHLPSLSDLVNMSSLPARLSSAASGAVTTTPYANGSHSSPPCPFACAASENYLAHL